MTSWPPATPIIGSRWRLRRMMQKLIRATCWGSPKWGLEIFVRQFFFYGNKRSGEVVSFFLKNNDVDFWDDVTGFTLNVFDQTVLEDPCLRQIHNPSKHQPGIQTLMVGFDYRTLWIQNLLAIRWPRVIQDSSKKLREYMTVYLKNQHFMVKIRKKSSPRTSPFAIANFSLQVGIFVPPKWAV